MISVALRGVVLVSAITVFTGSNYARRGWERVNLRCGASIRVPSHWIVVRAQPRQVEDSCAVHLSVHQKDGTLDHRVTLELFDAKSSEICKLLQICQDEAGVWQIEGRAGWLNRADEITVGGVRVIRGFSETGFYTDDGYQGRAAVPVAVIDNLHGRMAVIVGRHGLQESLFNAITDSLRIR